jgi:sterol desaturase/sphingolipid hydroxylase (fatty acid hydroxylase superfamily)
MAVDIWDRVFGTYKPLEWNEAEPPSRPRAALAVRQSTD